MASLFNAVVNESFGNIVGATPISENDAAEIDSRITDDPATMLEYTYECSTGMFAVEAAIAKIEGINAVKYLMAKNAGDTATMEATVIAMEGVFGDAWKKIKEWVIKMFNAVKKWLGKVWAKIKGRLSQLRGMVGKYKDVLEKKNTAGCKVSWQDIDFSAIVAKHTAVANAADHALKGILASKASKDDDDSAMNELAQSAVDEILTAVGINDKAEMGKLFSTNGDGSLGIGKVNEKVDFDDKKTEIFKWLDTNEDGFFKKMQAETEKLMNDSVKAADELEKETDKSADKKKGANGQKIVSAYRQAVSKAKELLSRIESHFNAAMSLMSSQCAAACRKAIMYNAEKKGGKDVKESFDGSSFDGTSTLEQMMAEML